MRGANSPLLKRVSTPFASSALPRVDLRSGVAVSARVAVSGATLGEWIEDLIDARAALHARGDKRPLSAPAPVGFFDFKMADIVDQALREAGFALRSVTIEVSEMELVGSADAMTQVERVRARGWGVALICAPDCPQAIGQRTRSLFTEMLADAPDPLTPAMALADPMHSPLTRRLRAAQSCGIATTALGVKSPAHAGLLIAIGFDRGEGPGYPG
jgi:hypothetical protein